MKKVLIGIVIVGVLVAGLATFGLVSAQTTTPQGDAPYGMGRRGMMANGQSFAGTGDGVLHDYMVAAFAEKLGVSVDVLNERLANGEHVVDIALEQGLTIDEFRSLMLDARTQAVEQALAEGVITQEQADWMKSHGGGMAGGRVGGMRGGMRGGFGANSANCPYYNQSAQ